MSGGADTRGRPVPVNANVHPTVKPIAVMRWLCRLITPPGGVVLDPFLGSGTTGCAAMLEGFHFVGIEKEAEYAAIAEARIKHWASEADDVQPTIKPKPPARQTRKRKPREEQPMLDL